MAQRLWRLATVSWLLAACTKEPVPSRTATNQPNVDTLGAAHELLFWKPEQQAPSYRNMNRIFPTRAFKASAKPYPLPPAAESLPPITYQLAGREFTLDSFLVRNHLAGLLLIKNGEIVSERYLQGNTDTTRWISFSVGKSIVSTLAGAAVQDGAIKSLDDPVTAYLPELKGTGYDGTNVRQLLQMSSGVKYNEDYRDSTAEIATVVKCIADREPGCILNAAKRWPRIAAPGTVFNYNTAETQLIGYLVQAATKKHLADYLAEKIWGPFGMERDGYWITEGEDGPEFAGGGCNMTLRDWGRFGLFMLGGGKANRRAVLPPDWIKAATQPGGPHLQYGKLYPGFPLGYGYYWWLYPPAVASANPAIDRAYEAEGVFGQTIHIDPKENLVVVTWSTWATADGPRENAENIAFIAAVTAALHRPRS